MKTPRSRDASRVVTRWGIYLGVTVAVAVSAYNFGRGSTSSIKSEPGRVTIGIDEARITRLEQEVLRLRRLERQVAQQAARQDHAPEAEAADVPVRDPLAEAVELPPAERAAKAREEEVAFYADLDARLAGETVDARWRAHTEAAITAVFPQQLGSDVALEEIECASSLCRVVVNHPNSPRIDGQKFTSLFLNRGALGEFALQADNSREGATTLYLVYGQALAQADGEEAERD